jgi:hypothetical protein
MAKIRLRAYNGKYVSANDSASGFTLTGNRDEAGEWETFEMEELDDDGTNPPDSGGTEPPITPDYGGIDDIDLGFAVVASSDCPSVAELQIISRVTEITLTDVGVDGQGYAMKFGGQETWPGVVPPGWEGPINHTLWMCEFINGTWYILPVKEGLGTYLTLGPILSQGQVPNNLTYYSSEPMLGYQPRKGEKVGFFCTTGDTRRMNIQPASTVGRTNVVTVPFKAGTYSWRRGNAI